MTMTAMQCDAAAIYDKRKDNLRFFLDNLPTHPCHVRPNFNLCTVCFKINQNIALSCEVYQRFNQGLIGSKNNEPVHVDLARSIDLAPTEASADVPEELEREFPLFEFSTPTVHKAIFDEPQEDELIDAEVVEAEVIEEEPPKPVVKPVQKVTPKPKEPVTVKRVVRPVAKPPPLKPAEAKPLPPPPKPAAPPAEPKPEEKKAPEAAAQPPVKTIKKVKMVAKAPPPKPTAIGPRPMPQGPPKPMATPGIKDVSKVSPGPTPAPGPSPLEPRPDLFPPPPGPGPSPSPEPDDDDEDTELLRKAPPGPPPKPMQAKPMGPQAGDKPPLPRGGVAPLYASLGKLETKKKPEE